MAERIQLTHPEGKKLSSIDISKYLTIKDAILHCLSDGVPVTQTELSQRVKSHIEASGAGFEGSIAWYTESVKLDLESKGMVLRLKEKQKVLFRQP